MHARNPSQESELYIPRNPENVSELEFIRNPNMAAS